MSYAVTKNAAGKHEMAVAEGVSVWWEGMFGEPQRVAAGASIDQWIDAAGMGWKIERAKVRFATGHGQSPADFSEMPGRVVLLRSDTKAPLGLVSDGYKVVQPREVVEFFRDLVEAAGFKMNTAGTLHGGSKLWAQANIADAMIGDDKQLSKLLLATACDGTMQTTAKIVNTSVVCANTLGVAMGERAGSIVKVSHRTKFDAAAVKRDLGMAVEAWAKFLGAARSMAATPISPVEFDAFLLRVMSGVSDAASDEATKARESRGFQRVIGLFDGGMIGADLAARKGTLWGAVNAVTEYVDHHVRATSTDNRIDSAQFGLGDRLKSDAFKAAAELIGA
jgi:phage/plasmid-like protein (TIGR03299 family)